MIIDIVYSTDKNYIKYVKVSLISVLENNKNIGIRVHILCKDVDETIKTHFRTVFSKYHNLSICFYDIELNSFSHFTDVSTYPGITLPAYFRLHLSSLLKSIDKALYLDGDTIVNGSLKELFDLELEGWYLAGVPDINCRSFEQYHSKYGLKEHSYINSGVVLFNLKAIREDALESNIDLFTITNKCDIKYGDQDILNLFFANKIYMLPPEYNVHGTNFFDRNTYKKPIIIHHVCKAWNYGQITYFQRYYFKYLRLSDSGFENRWIEFNWRIKSSVIAFVKFIKAPRTLFSWEYLYGVYKFTLRRLVKKEKY